MGRMEKVNQQVRRELGFIIQQEMSDPRLEFVSITHVKVSKDLRNARVYFSVIGDANAVEQSTKALDSARGAIRRQVGQKLKMRFTPELLFVYDNSMDMANRVEDTLKEIGNDNSDDHQDT